MTTRWHPCAIIARLLSPYADALRMDAAQMDRFARSTAAARFQHFVVTGAIAMVLFDLFLIVDRSMLPDVYEQAVVIRLYIVTPCVLTFVIGGALIRDWWLRTMPPWVAECITTASAMVASGSLGVLMLLSTSDMVSAYRAGLVPFLIFGNLVQRLRFRYALTSTLFNLGLCAVTMADSLSRPDLPYRYVAVPLALALLLVALYTLASNFNLEMDERHRFLQNERAQALRDELEKTHAELHALSKLDPLTGLANRRHFNDYADSLMKEGDDHRRIALLLIDVDHFKAYNDHYGHPAGDQCLRAVAASMVRAMSGRPGLLARWGGEEFAVILPDAGRHEAMAIAEAMRLRVAGQATRHKGSGTADHVTISCGIAFGVLRDLEALQRMTEEADTALYQAKSAGRNRSQVHGRPADDHALPRLDTSSQASWA